MVDIHPQLIYATDGYLTVERCEPEIDGGVQGCGYNGRANRMLEDRRDRAVEWLSYLPGVSIDVSTDTQRIVIPIEEAVGEALVEADTETSDKFLSSLSVLAPEKITNDAKDRVLTFNTLEDRLMVVTVYQQFQRWLNDGISETAALSCMKAMAEPYWRDATQDFSHSQNHSTTLYRSQGLEVATRQETFDVERYTEKRWSLRKSCGKVTWQCLNVRTYDDFGNPAISTSGISRSRIRHDEEDKRLYRMYSAEVANPIETVSLLLGLGRLAYYATQHQGDENIFAGIEWSKGQKWHAPVPTPIY